jgi:Domain of unknown function (DUF4389)
VAQSVRGPHVPQSRIGFGTELAVPFQRGVSMNQATSSYPVLLQAGYPAHYERIQVLYRFLLLIALGVLHRTVGSVAFILYLFLPIVAAISISRNGGIALRNEDKHWFNSIIDWAVSFYAYFLFVTDRFPYRPDERSAWLSVQVIGAPRIGSALGRLVTTLPHAIVLSLLGFAASVIALVIGVAVLATGRCPDGLHTFQREVVAWIGRVLAYHASLVDAYPPFSLAADEAHAHP